MSIDATILNVDRSRKSTRPPCWLCLMNGYVVRLNVSSRCPIHGMVRDRVLTIVQVDTRLLKGRVDADIVVKVEDDSL